MPIEDSPEQCEIWAYDAGINSGALALTEVCLRKGPDSVTDLHQTSIARIKQLYPNDQIIEDREFTLEPYQARRVVVENKGGISSTIWWVVYYHILDGETVWEVCFFTHINEYFTRIPEFDRSARTFHILP